MPLLSSASRVINGWHTYQTNMDPTVAMGTAAAAPQKGEGERERERRKEEEKWNVKWKTRGEGREE